MSEGQEGRAAAGWSGRIDRLAKDRPDIALMAPFMVYLILLGLREPMGYELRWLSTLLRGVGALGMVWIFRRHLPPWGKPHWLIAIPAGVLAAAGWYYGQLFFNHLGVPRVLPLPLFPSDAEVINPADKLGTGALYWTTIVLRIGVATTTVAIVEEIFWRAFLLRALIDWSNFEKVPLGRFTWRSFLATSLLSTIEHPANWLVSIPCWFFYNGLMIWKKSVLFLVITHGVTNLVLYIWVVREGAWSFW
jgi:hypothetical protein